MRVSNKQPPEDTPWITVINTRSNPNYDQADKMSLSDNIRTQSIIAYRLFSGQDDDSFWLGILDQRWGAEDLSKGVTVDG